MLLISFTIVLSLLIVCSTIAFCFLQREKSIAWSMATDRDDKYHQKIVQMINALRGKFFPDEEISIKTANEEHKNTVI